MEGVKEEKEEVMEEGEREVEGKEVRDAQEAIEETSMASPSQPHAEEVTVKVSKLYRLLYCF